MGQRWRLSVVYFRASPSKSGQKFCFWEMEWKCEILFLGSQKVHSSAKRRHFMYWSWTSVKEAPGLGWTKNQEKNKPCHFLRAYPGGSKNPYRIAMIFCAWVGVPDFITLNRFSDHQFRGFGDSRGSNFRPFHWFLLTFVVVLKTLRHYRASVSWARFAVER